MKSGITVIPLPYSEPPGPATSQTGATACSEAESWEPPIPLHRVDVPPFPVDVLPWWAVDYARAVAEFSQTPLDLAGELALAALSAAARGRFDVEAPAGHREAACLYSAVVLPPGERKSSVFAVMVAPVEEYERIESDRLAPQVAEEQFTRKVLGKRVEYLQAAASKERDPTERAALAAEAGDLAAELAALPPLQSGRLLVDDATPEALVGLLAEYGGNIAVLSAEGGTFDLQAGLYGEGRSNLDGILKAHDGESIRVDRRGRAPEHIPRATMTIGLAVQPVVIEGIMANSRFRGRGLVARFLYAVPESRVGCRAIATDPPPDALRVAYAAGLRTVLEASPADGTTVLRCSPGALAAFDDFRRVLEPRLHPDSGDLGGIGDWTGKLAGALARIGGLLHLAEHGARAEVVQVSEATMARALKLGPYLIGHALAAFGLMGADPTVVGARRILGWIEDVVAYGDASEIDRVFDSMADRVAAFEDCVAGLYDG